MPSFFKANNVAVAPQDWGLVVQLAGESAAGEPFYLMLQRQKHFTPDDERLGMADVHIEFCGQGLSWYGNIRSFRLLPGRVEVQMSPAAAAEMGNDGRIVVEFPPQQGQALSAAFAEVFAGRTYYSDESA
jgi:hypothetical protein